MRQPKITDVLNRVLHTVYRSLPMFVGEVSPYTHAGDESAEQLLSHIIADQKLYAGRTAALITELGGAPSPGPYPMVYCDLHMLSLDYLLKEITEQQGRDVRTLEDCTRQLGQNEQARTLVEEITGNARGHWQSLKELPAPATT